MKKTIAFLVTLSCCVYACKKDPGSTSNNEKPDFAKTILLSTIETDTTDKAICLSAFDAQKATIQWKKRGLGNVSVISPAYSNGIIYYSCDYANFQTNVFYYDLYASDAATGSDVWSITKSPKPVGFATPIGDTLYCTGGGYITARDPRTGHEFWTTPNGTAIALYDDDFFYFFTYPSYTETNLNAMDRVTKSIVWSLPVGINVYRGPSVIVEKQDYLYFTNGTGSLFCVNRLTGKPLWTVTGMDLASPVYGDDRIFCAAYGATGLYAFDAQSGTKKWQNEWYILDNPYFFDGTLSVAGADPEYFIGSLRAADGSIIWKQKTDLIYTGPVVTGNELYTLEAFNNPGGGHNIVVFDAESGLLKRKISFEADPQYQLGQLYIITSSDNYLFNNGY
jgi:outer membrane protein assembly factor BamB